MRDVIKFLSNKIVLVGILFIMVVTVAVSFGYKASKDETRMPTVKEIAPAKNIVSGPLAVRGDTVEKMAPAVNDNLSKLVLHVSNMSCSGCISTIKSSIAGFEGIQETLVDVGGGKVEIYYDGGKLKDVSPITEAITASGYPAKVQKNLSPEEVREERTAAEARSKYYVATVSGWDIARADFEAELQTARGRYEKIYGDKIFKTPQGESLIENLKAQILSKLVNEGIMMQEIVKSGFKVSNAVMEDAKQNLFNEHGKNQAGFKESLKEAGYDYDYFIRKFEIQTRINQYINDKILADAPNDFEKQNLFNLWFRNAKVLAEVVYYDRDLEQLMQRLNSASSCGGSS